MFANLQIKQIPGSLDLEKRLNEIGIEIIKIEEGSIIGRMSSDKYWNTFPNERVINSKEEGSRVVVDVPETYSNLISNVYLNGYSR
jgi:hypothetical protein